MNDFQLSEAWQIAILGIKEKAETSLKAFDIPIIRGSVSGNGCCFISVISAELSDYRNLFTEGSICVIDLEKFNDIKSEQDNDIYKGIKIYIRLGNSNTWLHFGWTIPEIDCDEDLFDDEVDLEEEMEKEELVTISLQVAKAPGFGSLKNKSQRLEFTQSILPKLYPDAISDYTTREIASRSESYYEFGVLPYQVRSLSQAGKSIPVIAKELGISKQKAERALTCEIPEFISDLLK